tara:strand:- start:153 stop:1166 length:1014 start_codon:yes stop_codon:yes gene_type:complete
MNQESVVCGKQEHPVCDRMLLSPTEALTTMALVPIAVFVLVLLAMMVPLQHSFGSNRTLDFSLFPDGSAHVFFELESNPLFPDTQITLFGELIENLVVEDENGFLLTTEPSQGDPNNFEVETLGASTILINYDTYSLVSKNGKVWSFAVDSPTEFSLLMPMNSLVVGMTTFPIDMSEEDDRIKMLLPPGPVELTYFLTHAESAQVNPVVETEDSSQPSIIIAITGIIIAVIIGVIFKFRKKSISNIQTESVKESTEQFGLESTLSDDNVRDDDKEIIKFIHENGGEVLESELRKKFLQPRTTMWRAVKRLERQGKIIISKKDQQNLVKLKTREDQDE